MATRNLSHGSGPHRIRSPILAAAAPLGIYIAMYLAVWLILRVLSFPDAAAVIAPDSPTTPLAAVAVSPSPTDRDNP